MPGPSANAEKYRQPPGPRKRPGLRGNYEAFRGHIDELPPYMQRVASAMLAGLSLQEAADRIGMTRGSVAVTVHKIRDRIANGRQVLPKLRLVLPVPQEPAPPAPEPTRAPAARDLSPEDMALVDSPTSPAVEKLRRDHKHTIPPRPLTPAERRLASLPIYPTDAKRPKTRGQCQGGPRPCPWTSCHHHLYLDANPTGSITLTFPDLDPDEIPETCSLDVADRGGITLEEVGRLCGLTRERIRQIEVMGLDNVRRQAKDSGPAPDRHGSPLAEIQG